MNNIRFARALQALIWLSAGAFWIVQGIYFYKFAPGNWFQLSDDADDWAAYGSFIGGLLGPVFSLFAFIGLLATVALQFRQARFSENDAKISALQELLKGIGETIDRELSERPSLVSAKKYEGNPPGRTTVKSALDSLAMASKGVHPILDASSQISME